MTKRTESKPAKTRGATRAAPPLNVGVQPDGDVEPEAGAGTREPISSEVRQRMICEAAYRFYVERGYLDGYDTHDWLRAEVEVDHQLLSSPDH